MTRISQTSYNCFLWRGQRYSKTELHLEMIWKFKIAAVAVAILAGVILLWWIKGCISETTKILDVEFDDSTHFCYLAIVRV